MMTFFIVMISGYALGGFGALFSRQDGARRAVAAAGAAIGSGTALGLGLTAIVQNGPAFTLAANWILPTAGIMLLLDGLSALFMVVIGLLGIAAAGYGLDFSKDYEGRYSLRLLGAMLNLLLLALSLCVLADNALTFLIAWEAMTLSAYWLVLTEHDQPGTVRAAIWYIAMTHSGFAALTAMFFLMSGGDLTTSFTAMHTNAAALPPALRNTVFVLALFGFGSKAGIVPLHVWLPMAHPVAPSHVSALMSGVVIKMGIYGLFRVVLELLGPGPTWWGGVVLGLGAISALLGVLYALMEHDLKQLLAYHSVENIGIILIGIGAGMVFQSYGLLLLAAFGFIGGMYHTINHAVFKGLLFLGAGSVLYATQTRNMEKLGGLIKRMPVTALCFLIGAAAISALPPLNGFVSEWIVFQSLLGGVSIPKPEVAVMMPIAVGMLALTSGLAAACFVKAFGVTFLAMPRSAEAEQASESPLLMRAAMGLLALTCIALGLAPFIVVPVLSQVTASLTGMAGTKAQFTLGLSLATPSGYGSMSPTLIAIGLLVVPVAAPFVMRLLRVNWNLRTGESWGCGRLGQTARMEYTATAFAEPLRRVFAELYRPTKELMIDFHPRSKYFVQSIEYHSEITPGFEKYLYDPCLRLIGLLAAFVRRMQSGSLPMYLVYVTLALVILLLSARW